MAKKLLFAKGCTGREPHAGRDEGGEAMFIDTEYDPWNMGPVVLEKISRPEHCLHE